MFIRRDNLKHIIVITVVIIIHIFIAAITSKLEHFYSLDGSETPSHWMISPNNTTVTKKNLSH